MGDKIGNTGKFVKMALKKAGGFVEKIKIDLSTFASDSSR